MKSIFSLLSIGLFIAVFVSCKSKPKEVPQDQASPKVSVKTTAVVRGNIDQLVELNGRSVYLRKNNVLSPISGYIKKINVRFGDAVRKGDLLFEIQTKENKALENSGLDSVLSSKSGVIRILAPSEGIISELSVNSSGMFIAEGSPLCTIVENKDQMVQVNVPYEYNSWIKRNTRCKIVLPDSTLLDGGIYRIMPVINETSQTQDVLIQIRGNRQLPENLNVVVQFIKLDHPQALLVPREALLTDESQQVYWVMKIMHDSLAVKVPVQKGFENSRMVEIVSPNVLVNDPVIIDGAYGLPDSTVVKIQK